MKRSSIKNKIKKIFSSIFLASTILPFYSIAAVSANEQNINAKEENKKHEINKNNYALKKSQKFSSKSFEYSFMMEAEDKNIYVVTLEDGLYKVDSKNEWTKISELDVYNGFIYQANDKTIYVGTNSNGLKKIVNDKLVDVSDKNTNGAFMYQTKDDSIYLGTYEEGLLKWDPTTKTFSQINDSRSIKNGFMYQTKDDTIYVGYKGGLFKLINGHYTNVLQKNVENGFMYQTQDGEVYLGTKYDGLMKLDGETFVNWNAIDVHGGFMFQRDNGVIYVGTNNHGIKELSGKEMHDAIDPEFLGEKKFETYTDTYNGYSYSIYSRNFMYQTNDGTIYVLTNDNEIKKLHFNQNILNINRKNYKLERSWKFSKEISGKELKYSFVLEAKNKNIYVGTIDNGLYKIDQQNKWTKISDLDFEEGFIYQVENETIYVGTLSQGLKKIENDELVDVSDKDMHGGFMHQTKDGSIYLGIYGDNDDSNSERGLWKLDPTSEELSQISNIDVADGFMYQTEDDTIYVGTYEKGIKKLADGKLVDFIKEDVQGGFMFQTKDNTIYVGTAEKGLMKLENDKLVSWNSTDVAHGFMFQRDDGTICIATNNDGLKELVGKQMIDISNQDISSGFVYKASDGNVYIGTHKNEIRRLVINKKFYRISDIDVSSGFIYQTIKNNIFIGTNRDGLMMMENDKIQKISNTHVAFGRMFQEKKSNNIFLRRLDGKWVTLEENGSKRSFDETHRQLKPNTVKVWQKSSNDDLIEWKRKADWRQQEGETGWSAYFRSIYFKSSIHLNEIIFKSYSDVIDMHYSKNKNKMYIVREYGGKYRASFREIVIYDIEKGTEINFPNNEFCTGGFIYETQDGTIYIGTKNGGIFKLNSSENGLVLVNKINVYGGFMYQTEDGTIYVGTNNQGLKKLDTNGNLTHVSDLNVFMGFMYQTKDGSIYLGTYKDGLFKLSNEKENDDVLKARIELEKLDGTKNNLQSQILPSKLVNEINPKKIGFIEPESFKKDNIKVVYKVNTYNDKKGQLTIKAKLWKNSSIIESTIFSLNGYKKSSSSEKSSSSADSKKPKSSLGGGAIAGIAIGTALVGALTSFLGIKFLPKILKK